MVLFATPFMVDATMFILQAQEVERIAKSSAQRVCSLASSPFNCLAYGTAQCSYSQAMDTQNFYSLAIGVIRTEAANFRQYAPNPPNSGEGSISLTLFDPHGQAISRDGAVVTGTPLNNILRGSGPAPADPPIDVGGNSSLYLGVNSDWGLCPSINGRNDWDWCSGAAAAGSRAAMAGYWLNPTFNAPNPALLGTSNSLEKRLESFQVGRAPAGVALGTPFGKVIDSCEVCVTRKRSAVFKNQNLFTGGECANEGDNKLLPCRLRACASAKYKRPNSVKAYIAAYKRLPYLPSLTLAQVEAGNNLSATSLIVNPAAAGPTRATYGQMLDAFTP